jgi:flavin-dependent dehydrogenase
MTSAPDADALIAGAGPAGVAAAIGLARQGRSVLLFDRARFPRDKPCGEGLLPQAVEALEALGVLDEVLRSAVAIEAIRFVGPGGVCASAPPCDRTGAPALALGIRRLALDALLLDRARSQPRVRVLEETAVLAPLVERGCVVGLSTARGRFYAPITVIADGLRSPLRAALGLARSPAPRRRMGLRAHFAVDRLPAGRAVEVQIGDTLDYYLTPVGEHLVEIAILGDLAAFAHTGLSARTFADHLRRHPTLGPRLREAEPIEAAHGAGPFSQRARSPITDGALLVGDASGYFDPITGEGVGFALASGVAAAEVIGQALVAAPDRPIAARALRPYARTLAKLRQSSDRLTAVVLWLARHPLAAVRAVSALDRTPELFHRLLQVQAGAPLSVVSIRDWWRLFGGVAPLSPARRPAATGGN